MRYVFVLVGLLLPGILSAQILELAENLDFNNYSLMPALANPDNRMNSTLIYQKSSIDVANREPALQGITGQVNYWTDKRNNIGISWFRANNEST